jgi:hypothetical protein
LIGFFGLTLTTAKQAMKQRLTVITLKTVSKLWIIPAVCLVVACTTIEPLPEEVQDADGIGGATAKVEFVKWLGQLILVTVGSIKLNVNVEAKESK